MRIYIGGRPGASGTSGGKGEAPAEPNSVAVAAQVCRWKEQYLEHRDRDGRGTSKPLRLGWSVNAATSALDADHTALLDETTVQVGLPLQLRQRRAQRPSKHDRAPGHRPRKLRLER